MGFLSAVSAFCSRSGAVPLLLEGVDILHQILRPVFLLYYLIASSPDSVSENQCSLSIFVSLLWTVCGQGIDSRGAGSAHLLEVLLVKRRMSLPNTISRETYPRALGSRDGKYTGRLPLDWDVPDGCIEGIIILWFR